MTVSTETAGISYDGNGITTVFSVPFYFLESSHIRVVLRSSAGVEYTKTLTTDYTVAGSGTNPSTATVTCVSFTPATGEKLRIVRDPPLTQETDYVENDPFPAETHEKALDKLTMIDQAIASDVSRALKWPETSSASSLLPDPAGNGNRFLANNPSGTAIVFADSGSGSLTNVDYKFASVAAMSGQTGMANNAIGITYGYYTANDNGHGTYRYDSSSTATVNGGSVINASGGAGRWLLLYSGSVNVKQFGAKGDGVTDDTAAALEWLSYLAANPSKIGIAVDGVFALNSISLTAANGLNISGNATFKAIGANRLNMIEVTGVMGRLIVDGITIDGSNMVARPLEIKNVGGATAGNVFIGPACRFINAKNISPRTDVSSGFRIQGKFDDVVFEGEVDGVDNDMTSGAVSVGAWFDWSGTSFIKNVIITSKARIKNVKNSNTVTADCDGVQRMGPTTEKLTFTVEPGAYFENCKGRTIKSQVTGNAINSPVIVRNLYDGLVEIDCQYAGGHCVGARIYYDGVRVDRVIGSTTRLGLPSDFTMRDNRLEIKNDPVTKTGSMCLFWGTDNTDAITQDGLICEGNRVIGGSVDHMATVYAANVVNTNFAVIRDNYAEGIVTSYLDMQLVYNNPARLTVLFDGNSCKTQCTGATVVSGGQLLVASNRGNRNISPLPVAQHAISGGVLTLYAGNHIPVTTEGGAGFDDIDTISGGNYAIGDIVVFTQANAGLAPKFKNGTGNILLSGSDFELNSQKDRLVLSYDSTLNQWHEISRSNNG